MATRRIFRPKTVGTEAAQRTIQQEVGQWAALLVPDLIQGEMAGETREERSTRADLAIEQNDQR